MGAYDAYNMVSAQSTNITSKQMKLKSKSGNKWTSGSKGTERYLRFISDLRLIVLSNTAILFVRSQLAQKTRYRDMSDEEEEEE